MGLRVIRIIGMFERLATLVEAFIESLKQVAWVACLCLIIFYVFAVLGKELLGDNEQLQQNPDYNQEWWSTIPNAMLTLFQLMTMDDWANIMRPVGTTLPASWLFTLTFVLLGICLMNLIIAIFIDELFKQTSMAEE